MILRRYKGPAFAKYCLCFPPHRILGECKKTLPTSFPMHVGIPDCLTIHHCTVYNPIMIIHLFVMGLDNWSSAFTYSRFIDRLTPMTSHMWHEKLSSEICILRNSKFELLKLEMCSILNKKKSTWIILSTFFLSYIKKSEVVIISLGINLVMYTIYG